MGAIIDGKLWAAKTKENIRTQVEELKKRGLVPKLTVIQVGENPASTVYVNGKEKDCAECGFESEVLRLDAAVSEAELLAEIEKRNTDKAVNGLIVQLPLPKHIDENKVINAISPAKDVDGFTPVNVGHMTIGEECFLPCTPAGCIKLIETTGINIAGKQAVVIGRSNIVGKPAALLLLQKNATVTICHSKTQNLKEICMDADILVVAIGRANFITSDMIKPGAVVIDVGMNRNDQGKLCGDVDFAACKEVAGYITPVPGGVGLMTRAMLMENTLKALKIQHQL
ncbi:MAG: bifunctional methylenetetrahydrofolate dehydrogenase/methenyltetrahydrofolate cyclohydrolase FolD [Oscillospiraceae bacterium]|nr:bifunctional methylenetetrahydrofolate dehydrogenase/methenyltetrahydrofolate cyclohydrolase FolD [Oscillospiraceae bacterium]